MEFNRPLYEKTQDSGENFGVKLVLLNGLFGLSFIQAA